MQTIKINTDQTIVDAALQYLGDASQSVNIALQNDKSLTDDLVSADIGDADVSKQKTVETLNKNYNIPASADNTVPGEGIGYWRIGIDFKIS